MRIALLVFFTSLLLIMTGCSSAFHGEWLEDGVAQPDGSITPLAANHRKMALKFDMPWTVRYGDYVDTMNVVDGESVQSKEYYTCDGGDTAEFGAMIARREGNRLVLVVGSERSQRHFTRVQGRSIFPPILRWPPMSKADGVVPADQYAALLNHYGKVLDAQEAILKG